MVHRQYASWQRQLHMYGQIGMDRHEHRLSSRCRMCFRIFVNILHGNLYKPVPSPYADRREVARGERYRYLWFIAGIALPHASEPRRLLHAQIDLAQARAR